MAKRAVALAVGVLLVAGCSGSPDGAASSTVSPSTDSPAVGESTSVAPTVAAADDADSWTDLAQGPAPQIPYVAGNRVVTPRREVTLPMRGRGISGVVAVAGGFMVADAIFFEGTNGVHLIRHGSQVTTWPSAAHCSSGSPVASADGDLVAWVTVRCPESLDRTIGAVHRSRASGADHTSQPIGTGLAHVVGFLGGRVVFNRGFVQGGWITDFRRPPIRIPHVQGIRDVAPRRGLLIGITHRGSHVVVDPHGRRHWASPAGELVAFSPDGAHVLATVGRHRLLILDARDGSTASTIDLPRGAQSWSTVWESAETLLILHQRRGHVCVVRLAADGRPEQAAPALRARPGRTPYLLLPHA